MRHRDPHDDPPRRRPVRLIAVRKGAAYGCMAAQSGWHQRFRSTGAGFWPGAAKVPSSPRRSAQLGKPQMGDKPTPSPLLKADSATLAFSANADGSLSRYLPEPRARHGTWLGRTQ
jgi:hypothetical protein